MEPANTSPIPAKKSAKRRGVVIVAVLVVVTLLSLAAYQYNDLMFAEYRASNNAHRIAQARAFAESGIHFTAAALSNPENIASALGGNPWNNPDVFRGQEILGDGSLKGKFSIIAPPDANDTSVGSVRYGVTDESSKINLNAIMKLDTTGQTAHDMLMKLPNMTEEIANAIVDWMDPDSDTRTGGAENDYYSGLTPSYRCKNGPIDSIDELLLVKGVTRDLLYGTDGNRNGAQDAEENGSNGFSRGWSAYLTVHSREQNSDPTGVPYINLNNADLSQLNDALIPEVGENLAKFIVIYRQYGPSNSAGTQQSLGSTIASLLMGGKSPSSSSSSTAGDLSAYQLKFTRSGSNQFKSMFDLVNAQVSIKSVDARGKTTTKVYSSPLNDPAQLADLFPKVYGRCTLTTDPEIPARININTAPREVLLTLPEVTEADVDKVINTREGLMDVSQSPVWLLTDAQLSVSLLQKLDKYVTARTQVYRVQSVGYFDGKGPAIRIEAVIDSNSGRPRILAWRDLSELGKGWTDPNP